MMKSTTRLDSVVFHLTPTRTRCDLVIIANGKTEKIVSGLLNPFLAHLKTAQEQLAKGGYSITLEPNSGSDAAWFTKGTVERFVRFVNTPEVLERVKTIESEILQIEEAIAFQSSENLGLSTVEDHQTRSVESIEGSKPVPDADAAKAIVLYQPGTPPPESNGSTMQEENSKVKLLKVLETRKTVLQKEQGMAFARAVAAGFDMDHMAPLISLAECFGATRLMEACIRFMELWKGKHESGQWLEIEAAETMSSRSELSSMNASGIIFPSEIKKQKEFSEAWPESRGDLGLLESNGKANGADADMSSHQNGDKKPLMDPQLPLGHHEYFQGQFQHPMFPQWPIHSPPGAPPVFQGYHPMQGMPYYQSYPGNGPFFPPPYPPPVEDSRFSAAPRMGQKRHSMDSKDSYTESEREMGASNKKSSDGSELEKEFQEPRRKTGRSDKRRSGMVVIRNINYVTSNRRNSSGSESHSASDPDTDEEPEDLQVDAPDVKHKNHTRSSKSNGSHTKSNDAWDSYGKDESLSGQGADGGHWLAFQNCLLKDDNENSRGVNEGMFAMEKESKGRRRKNTDGDPIVPHGRDSGEVHEGRITEFDTISAKLTCMLKLENEELVHSKGELPGGGSRDGQLDLQFTEIEGGRRGYKTSEDNFMMYGRENHSGVTNFQSDPLSGNEFGHAANNSDRRSSHNITDESFIVPHRANSADQVGTDSRMAIDIGSELPSTVQKTEDSSRIRGQLSYEPDDLSLMPVRGAEKETIGYDPAVDYEMQVHTEDVTEKNRNKEENVTKVGSKKSDKDKKSKVIRDSLEKRKIEAATRKGKPSKLSPLTEAQARAERLRAFKADLQKVKKEKEEEEAQRLEALKRERQKRIAARGSSGPAPSPLSSQQTRSRMPMKLSPSAQKSKFSDSDPAPVSPLQRLPIRTASISSSDSQKITKISRLSSGPLGGNGLSQSLSSLPGQKKEIDGSTPESRATTMRTRRLSDHKTSNSHHVSSVKSRSAEPVSKPKLSNGPEVKKISAIISLDRTKAATLPELKIRTSKGPSDIDHNKSAAKEATQKANVNKSSVSSEDTKLRRNDKTAHSSSGDENPIIEKTVVMLEPEVPPIPVAHPSEERMEMKRGPYDEDKAGAKTDVVSEYAAIHAPVSPLNGDASEFHLEERPDFSEVTKDYGIEELPKVSSISIAEKTYQAPYARASSLEDPCTTNLEFSKAPATTLPMGATSTETTKAYVSDFTVLNSTEKVPEALEKPRKKESKGFRRLLKFGRKNNSSSAAECNVESESDKLSVDSSGAEHERTTASSDEANMLKNLISQDETPKAVTTPRKVSKSFSLLSPFRSKNSEKKLTT